MTIEYVLVMHDGSKATKFMSEDYCKDLMEQLAAAQSREVCTVAHENVETCGYCQRDALTAENAALREERALIIQRAENAEAALVAEVAKNGRHAMRVTIAQLEARLANVRAWLADPRMSQWTYMENGEFYDDLSDQIVAIDAFLAREAKP